MSPSQAIDVPISRFTLAIEVTTDWTFSSDPLAVVDEDHSATSRELLRRAIVGIVDQQTSIDQARHVLETGKAEGIPLIPANPERDIYIPTLALVLSLRSPASTTNSTRGKWRMPVVLTSRRPGQPSRP